MSKYYLPSVGGQEEVTERVWRTVVGNHTAIDYARRLADGEIVLEDIPEPCREIAFEATKNRYARYSKWVELDVFTLRGAAETTYIARVSGRGAA